MVLGRFAKSANRNGGYIMLRYCLPVAMLATSSLAYAQTTPVPPASVQAVATPVAPATRQVALPPNTEVVVTPNDTLTTKRMKLGDKFTLAVVFDVMQDGFVMIPKGTPGQGTVVYTTKTGAFGKSGKMDVEFNWLDLHGQRIPLSGSHHQEGEGNTGATVGTAVAVGPFAVFVKGHSATITNGEQLRAHTVEPLAFEVPANAPQVISGRLIPAATAAPAALTPVATPVEAKSGT